MVLHPKGVIVAGTDDRRPCFARGPSDAVVGEDVHHIAEVVGEFVVAAAQ